MIYPLHVRRDILELSRISQKQCNTRKCKIGGKEISDTTFMNLNKGITMCLDTYYDINSVRQHNCFYYTT